MENIQLRSDGIWETSSGFFAIVMMRSSGQDQEMKWFEFVPNVSIDTVIRAEWTKVVPHDIVLVDQVYAGVMIRKGYSRHPSDKEAEAYNDWAAEQVDAPIEPPAEPVSGQPGTGVAAPENVPAANTKSEVPPPPAEKKEEAKSEEKKEEAKSASKKKASEKK